MSEQQNVDYVNDIYAAFGRGDIPYILNKVPPDIQWAGHMDKVVPWSGSYTGRIGEFFKAIGESVDVLSWEPGESVAQGDTVVTLGYFGSRSKATGKSARTKWVFVWKFNDGKLESYEQFHDPAIADIFRA
jgi:ketosteroid isomerase-like protein